MKILIICIIICLNSVNLVAQTYYMKVNLNDGTKNSISISEIKKITFSGLTSIEDPGKIKTVVDNFVLFQNYPNPFNPSTNIQYNLSIPGNVEVSIYNISGQKIRQLVCENQQEGNHTLVWDGKNNNGEAVTSGLYLYKVIFENTVSSKKMILVK